MTHLGNQGARYPCTSPPRRVWPLAPLRIRGPGGEVGRKLERCLTPSILRHKGFWHLGVSLDTAGTPRRSWTHVLTDRCLAHGTYSCKLLSRCPRSDASTAI